MSSKKCPHCGLYSTESALRCDCGYDFTSKELKSSYLQTPKPISTTGAPPLASADRARWIQWICWIFIGLFAVGKVFALTQGQSLPDWLDVTNPSPIGLVFTASVVTLLVLKLNR